LAEFSTGIARLVQQFQDDKLSDSLLSRACEIVQSASFEWAKSADRDIQDLISLLLYRLRDSLDLQRNFNHLKNMFDLPECNQKKSHTKVQLYDRGFFYQRIYCCF
jgi:hypothetical protein